MKRWIVGAWLTVSLFSARAQSVNEQVWIEYMGNYSFASSFNFESAFSFSTVLTSPKWKDFNYSATVEWSINQSIEPIAQLSLTYTKQTETSNTGEVRPVIGCRFYLTPARRIQTRLLIRLEDRNFKDLETGEWTQAIRPRLRAEAIWPITQDSYFKDNLWYAITDVEAIFTTNDLKERFANRLRVRAGIGYRLSYALRFEVMYMYQASRNGIDQDFTSSDNIFRFRLKHYLRKTKPSKQEGGGT